ncbi:MAG TPA: SpoIIE family protein phosphatase [Flavobacteriales bacterium]
MIPVEWVPAIVLLLFAVGSAFALERSRKRNIALEQDRSGYVQIFEQANDGVIVLDFVNGRIHRANPRAAAMLGLSVERLEGSTIFDVHFPEDLERSAMRIADVWSSGGLVYDDIPFRTATGERLAVECSAKVTQYDNKPAVVIYARDISERLKLQQQVAEKNALVEHQNREMLSGLRYAQGIQAGMLPSLGQFRTTFSDAHVFYRPRDIVSGDFFWSAKVGERTVVAAADCTGHGVPGALLSMTGIALLQQIVAGRGVTDPAAVLSELRTDLLRALAHQEGEGQLRDGMNIGCFTFDATDGSAFYAGALCPLYILRKGMDAVEEMKGDRIPVGFQEELLKPFHTHPITVGKGDRIYLASDGFADQFGGPAGRKFKASSLRNLIAATGSLSLSAQGRMLERSFVEWMGQEDQIDDVMVLALQL